MTLRLLSFVERQIEQTVTRGRVHVEQLRPRAETRRHPVRPAIVVGPDERSINLWLLLRTRDRFSTLIQAGRPVERDKRGGEQVLAGLTVEHEEVSVTARLRQQLALRAVEL